MIDVIKASLSSLTKSADMSLFIEIMHVLTYLKIICTQHGARSLNRYKDAVESGQLLETLIESYISTNSQGKQALKSATYTIEFLGFIGA